jgi:hypothetical protein
LLLGVALAHSPVGLQASIEEQGMTEKDHQPGPGRATGESAFNDLRKQIAARNEEAHKVARKIRAKRDDRLLMERRERDR